MSRLFEEAMMEGEIRQAVQIAIKLIRHGKYTLEEIAEDTGLPLEKVQELAGVKTA